MHAWVDKLETNLSHSADAFKQHKPSLDILRDTIDDKLPEYTDGADIETIIADLIRSGRANGIGQCVPATLPHDAIVQLLPGADLPETGVDALIEIPGVWSSAAPDDILGPTSMLICKHPTDANLNGSHFGVPFSLGMAIPGSDADAADDIIVAWWVPGSSASATLKPGKRRR